MPSKEEIIGGIFRGALTGGSWLRIAIWCRSAPRREVDIRLSYPAEKANWKMKLSEDKIPVFDGESESLEGVTMLAVNALGKAR